MHINLHVQKTFPCTPVLTLPQSPVQHLQVLIDRLNQIECQSLTRRVLHHLPNWNILTQDNWVLQAVQGYMIDLIETPRQTHWPPPIVTSLDNHALVTQEVQELIRKGAIVETTVSLNSFISQLFLVEKKRGGGATTSHQPEGIESVCSGGTLQNGRSTSPSRLNPARGLDDKNGPQRCLFASANPRSSSMFSPVCLGRETLEISVPTIWPVISTKGVYQTPETSCGPTQTDRPTVDT